MLGLTLLLTSMLLPAPHTVFVSPTGKDNWPGTREQPLATLDRALRSQAKEIVLREGTYVQPHYLEISIDSSGTTIRGESGERAIITGATPLKLKWAPYKHGIWQASVLNTGKLGIRRLSSECAAGPQEGLQGRTRIGLTPAVEVCKPGGRQSNRRRGRRRLSRHR